MYLFMFYIFHQFRVSSFSSFSCTLIHPSKDSQILFSFHQYAAAAEVAVVAEVVDVEADAEEEGDAAAEDVEVIKLASTPIRSGQSCPPVSERGFEVNARIMASTLNEPLSPYKFKLTTLKTKLVMITMNLGYSHKKFRWTLLCVFWGGGNCVKNFRRGVGYFAWDAYAV